MPELAIDRYRRHFATHPDMVAWRVECVTLGHSFSTVTDNEQPLYIPRGASLVEFQEAVRHRPGLYRLVQTNQAGQDLPGHVAYVEIHSRNVGGDTQQFSADRAYALADRMARTNEHCLSLVANLTDRLMTTHVQLQTGSARLLEAATGAIKVTTGIERIERDKIDMGEMCQRIVEAIEEREQDESGPVAPEHWIVALSNSPIGKTMNTFLNLYAQSMAQQLARKHSKAKSEE